MDKRIKIGIYGLCRGIIMLWNAKLLSDYIEVTGVCEGNPETLEKARKDFLPETKVYDDYDALLNSGIDAVFLANYFPDHAKCAIKAFKAGVAVLSETTAAPTLGECVDLVEAAEKYNGKYMLAANCLYFRALYAMKAKLEAKEYGRLVYADAEYIHPPEPLDLDSPEAIAENDANIDLNNLHWRQTLPAGYYNMHSLAPLMFVSNSIPKKVVAKVAQIPQLGKVKDGAKSYGLYEMDNGAIFNSTGCVGVGSKSKWYRLACQKGTMETVRYQENQEEIIEADHESKDVRTTPLDWATSGILSQEDQERFAGEIEKAGHGGIDFAMVVHFIKFMNGEEEPFFNVYRSTTLSAAGILSWYSALSGSKEMEIPDFSKKEDRDKVRGDYRSPFAKKYRDVTLPCKVGEPFER